MNSLRDTERPGWTAFEEDLLTEMYRQMLRVARHRLHHKSDAGDIVQEAWVRILEKLDTLRSSDKIIPWAKTIAANLASNANRSRRAETICESSDNYAESIRTSPRPDLMMELSDLLGRLDPQTRTLLLYKFYYGFKDDEIAAALDVPVGTIKARIHRSKERLKAQEWYEE